MVLDHVEGSKLAAVVGSLAIQSTPIIPKRLFGTVTAVQGMEEPAVLHLGALARLALAQVLSDVATGPVWVGHWPTQKASLSTRD